MLNYVDEEPYIFLVAVGNCNSSSVSTHDMYTVHYACYVAEKDSRPYYYYNGQWSADNATNINSIRKDERNKTNYLIEGTEELHIQYYIIANKDNRSLSGLSDQSFWGYLRNYLPKLYGDKAM